MLTRPIKLKIREQLDQNPFMHKCCIADGYCKGRIEWQHHLKWKGQRSDEPEHILPLCSYHHSKVDTREVREKVDWVWLNRLTDDQIQSISKAVNYLQRKVYLNGKYGSYSNNNYNTRNTSKY